MKISSQWPWALGMAWLPKVDAQHPFLPFSQVLLWKRFGNPKDTLPEIAKPLNPTASTRKEIAIPLVWEKPTTRSKVASMPKPVNGNSRGKCHFRVSQPKFMNSSQRIYFLCDGKSWTQAFRTHILAQYLQSYRDISWLYDFANITQVFCELFNNFLVCLKHCIVPGGTMMPMGWGMFIISCSWVVPPAISKTVSDSPLITPVMVFHRKWNKSKIVLLLPKVIRKQ